MHKMRENCCEARDIFTSILKLRTPVETFTVFFVLSQFNYFCFHLLYRAF